MLTSPIFKTVLIVITLLCLLLSVGLIIFGIHLLGWEYNFSTIYTLIIPPLIYIVISSLAIYRLIKTLQYHQDLKEVFLSKKVFWIFYLISLVSILIIVRLLYLSITNEAPPQFFPLDDPQASYTIIKKDGFYHLHYLSTSDKNSFYVCSWGEDKKKSCQEEIHRDVETIIGHSEAELEPFVNKNVLVEGEFVYSKSQCIKDSCKDYTEGSRAVFNIKKIDDVR